MIELERKQDIAILKLAHEKANALDRELLEALEAQLSALGSSEARAVILTGSGGIFSAGVDLFRLVREGSGYVEQFLPSLCKAVERLFTFPKPVIAAVNGHAIAGGCVLALACDYRIMAEGNGRIGVPELLVGVPFPAIVLEVLRFALPAERLQEIVYTGATWKAAEAQRYGILDEVVEAERLMEAAEGIAIRLSALPPEAFALTKRQLRCLALERVERYGAQIDSAAMKIWASDETRAGIAAYLERTVGKRG